ncbi:MAG: helix-turn-helix transcriptional regulator [Rhodospirillaceae bacterium]|nr:helix-turn-helix transcriptional regulator [Rhodospirillaceae bacterium]
MVQSKRIVRALKEALKARRISYGQVAEHLDLSLSSVKRLFSTGSFSLARLEEVCNLAGIDLLDLARLAEENRLRVSSLTADQERQLVSDPDLLLTAVCVFNRSTYERILRNYRFSEVQLTKLLLRLDRMGLIELLPDNRIRRRIARKFAWLPGGPIHRYFVERVQGEFLSGAFDPNRDAQRFAWGMVSEQSATALRAKVAELMDAFDEVTRRDEVRADVNARGTCLLVAFRQWEPAAFATMRRPHG